MAALDRDLDDLPPVFLERMVEVLGSREALAEVLEAETRPALRVNTLKTTVEEAAGRRPAQTVGGLTPAITPVETRRP